MYENSPKPITNKRKVVSLITLHVVITALIFALIIIGFPCPFKLIFGIPCPACGTVHALRAIVELNFEGYIQHNCLAIPLVLAVWLGIHKRKLFRNSKSIDIFIYIICFLDIFRYFSKIFVDFL